MEFLIIPEWEIEEAILRRPSILGLNDILKNPVLVGQQFYLTKTGRYIDLLFVSDDSQYLMVELKRDFIDEESVLYDQLLKYKSELARQLKISDTQILCMLASPMGISSRIIEICKKENVIWRHVDEKLLSHIVAGRSKEPEKENLIKRLLLRRYPKGSSAKDQDDDMDEKKIKSVIHYIDSAGHDEVAKESIGELFTSISARAPLCAHEIFERAYEEFRDETEKWFWIFYSVLDRRANASTFIKASQYLANENLYDPKSICRSVRAKGKDDTIQTIHDILEQSKFPLCSDSTRFDLSMPTSIVEAALWYERHDFSMEKVRRKYENKRDSKKIVALELVKELKKNIYGVGERIASQIVRGFILKDKWNWNVNHATFLEKCKFNVMFSSKLRLNLVSESPRYTRELQEYCDKYLGGNYCIASHVLWYIRKRYCSRPKRCFECPVAGYCNYYLKTLYWNVPQHELTLFDYAEYNDK